LRIISGKLKGRRLASFGGRRIRPTSDMVREAIFDILTVGWEGKEVLDLFSGTGALGIEALSRGASQGVFVENHSHSLLLLDKNINTLSLSDLCEVVRFGVEKGIRFLKKREWKFDVVFLDPPYGKGLTDDTLRLIAGSDILKEDAVVVAEHHYKEILSDRYRKLQLSDQRKYGSTGVSFFYAR
jgi:16S rRNA (guanine966-N2)-methyltransferase